ncbi:MAG TPA: hypothetical protein VF148_17580 [Acidimicrobiia bacterium]
MPHLPLLRVVPLESIRRHEESDPLRVERLVRRIDAEGVQVNPMVCTLAPNGELILLDGATRTESLKRLGFEHAVVQMVERDKVTLGTWQHVVRGCGREELVQAVAERSDLLLSEEKGTPGIHLKDGGSRLVLGEGVSANATLSSLVGTYMGRWRVSRVAETGIDSVARSFPDWSAVIEFPTLSLDDVMKAAITDDLLPAGITRFLVDERALLLNAPLDLLAGEGSMDEKQERLDELITERAQDGRVRRYEETVFILDE